MTRTLLFVGPTIPGAAESPEARGLEIHPPIEAGDLFRLAPEKGDTIGIIDGYFHQARAIPHKEILTYLANGVRVLGASSIGALRAAELAPYGMVGIGRVYQDFASGRLNADDDVAVLHGPVESGYLPMSEALVNIRATLCHAEASGLCSERQRRWLIGQLELLPYRERSYRRLVEMAADVRPALDTNALAEFCRECRIDLKGCDARQLVRGLRTDRVRSEVSELPELSRTLFVYAWELSARRTVSRNVPDLAAFRALQLFVPEYPVTHRQIVLSWLADRCLEGCGLADPADTTEAIAVSHASHTGLCPKPDVAAQAAYLDLWTTAAERGLALTERMARFLVRSFRVAPGIVYDELPLRALGSDLARGARVAEMAVAVNTMTKEENADFELRTLRTERIRAFLINLWGVDGDRLEFEALDRGFDSLAGAIAATRHFYLLGAYNLDRVRAAMSGEESG